jgi:hypothetical protein
MKKTLAILAAGLGSRYGGLKQMVPMGPSGEFIIDYSIYDAIRSGFTKVVILIRPQMEADFRATIGSRVERRIEVQYVYQHIDRLPGGFTPSTERQKPWGTGHAALSCAPGIKDEPFGVINADDFYGADAFRALAGFLDATAQDPARYCMAGFILRNTMSEFGSVARGICRITPDLFLKTVVERTQIEPVGEAARFKDDDGQWQPLTGDEYASMNMWGLKPSVFPHLEAYFIDFLKTYAKDAKKEFFLPFVINDLMARGLVTTTVVPTSSKWFGVTYPQEREMVVTRLLQLVEQGAYPRSLWG